jgi:hypothetical protein
MAVAYFMSHAPKGHFFTPALAKRSAAFAPIKKHLLG